MNYMEKYTIEVPYEWSDCCRMGEDKVEIELYAKSEEQARYFAKSAIENVIGVTKVYSTELL